MSGVWPSTAPDATTSTSMNRANTCASGMNSNVRAPSWETTSGSPIAPSWASEVKLPCVSSAPLGRPVVPEV